MRKGWDGGDGWDTFVGELLEIGCLDGISDEGKVDASGLNFTAFYPELIKILLFSAMAMTYKSQL